MSNPFIVLKNNWKKVVFGLGVSYYGLYRVYDYCLITSAMRANCIRAREFGDVPLEPSRQPRHITVILNPAAGKRKTRKLYEKFVEPLLHLAGIKVSLVETEYPGQAEALMGVMSNCDGVAIVGGDGTVHEAVNGLLKRPDRAHAVKMFPLAIIPTGRTNGIAAFVHRNINYPNYRELLMMSTMSLIKSMHEPVDVVGMIRTNQNKNQTEGQQTDESQEDNTIEYVISDLRNGVYQDVITRTSGKLLYQRYLRPTFTRMMRYLRPDKYPTACIQSILYTPPCDGCSKCYNKRLMHNDPGLHLNQVQPDKPKGWWTKLSLLPSSSKPVSQDTGNKPEIDYSKRDHIDCGLWHELKIDESITDIRVYNTGDRKLCINMCRNKESEPCEHHHALDVKLIVDENKLPRVEMPEPSTEIDNDENTDPQVSADKKYKQEQKELEEAKVKFIVDSQMHRAYSVELSSKIDAIRVFTGQ